MNINMTIVWLFILVGLLIVEFLTMALTTIWFAGGALAAIVASELNAPIVVQIVVFLAVSLVVLFLLRPKAVSYFNNARQKTNADVVIGKKAKIIETVNNKENTGRAVINGMEWTTRAEDENDVFEVDEMAEIVGISGVKIILKKKQEEK